MSFHLVAHSLSSYFTKYPKQKEKSQGPIKLVIYRQESLFSIHACSSCTYNNSVLETLKKRILERESCQSSAQNQEKIAWEEFWREHGPKLFKYACTHGSVDSLKELLEIDEKSEKKCLRSDD